MHYPTKTYFRNWGNHQPELVVDLARRLGDSILFTAKSGQNNQRVFKKGYLRMRWPNRRMARKYQALVTEFFGHLAYTKRFRSKNARRTKRADRK